MTQPEYLFRDGVFVVLLSAHDDIPAGSVGQVVRDSQHVNPSIDFLLIVGSDAVTWQRTVPTSKLRLLSETVLRAWREESPWVGVVREFVKRKLATILAEIPHRLEFEYLPGGDDVQCADGVTDGTALPTLVVRILAKARELKGETDPNCPWSRVRKVLQPYDFPEEGKPTPGEWLLKAEARYVATQCGEPDADVKVELVPTS